MTIGKHSDSTKGEAVSTFSIGRKPYFDIKDTIEEVGITRRQLSYWESEGLITAELGPDSKKYTTYDIGRLKALRHLIVERSLPFPLVKKLVQGTLDEAAELSLVLIRTSALFDNAEPHLGDQVLDIEKGGLKRRSEIAEEWWHRFFATASEEQVTERLLELGLILFRTIRNVWNKPAAYRERTNDVLKKFSRLPDMARNQLFWMGDGDVSVYRSPRLVDEREDYDVDAGDDFVSRARALLPYCSSLLDSEGRVAPEYSQHAKKFWTKEELDALEESQFNNVPF